MKTAFIAYRHSGEDPGQLKPMLSGVRDKLEELGIEAYCTFFHEENFQERHLDARAIMEHAFATIQTKDLLFVIQAKNEKSEGMIMEVGRFFGKMPIILAKHVDVDNTYLPLMADASYEWSTQDELVNGIAPVIRQLK